MSNKILIVDDEDHLRMLIEQALEELEDEGVDFFTAANGEEALEQFKQNPPDLVILDINMPGMNGIEVLRRMKEVNPNLPVILSSAYQEYKQDLGTWASEDYIVKSANMDELKNAVRKHLG